MKNSIKNSLLRAWGFAAGICLIGNLQAGQIQGVTISAYSFQYSNPPVFDSVSNLVSSTGLFGDLHVNVPGGAMWYSSNSLPGTNFVTFNFGKVYTVNAMKVWNYNDPANLGIGVSNASICYSTDGVHFTTNIILQNFMRGEGLLGSVGQYIVMGQTIPMTNPVTAQYIRINFRTNWAQNATGVGLSKVRFISNTNPPAVLSASENYGSNQITVIFSEPVDAASSTTLANYSISGSPAATISSVSMGEYADRVILQTSPLAGNNYSVGVSGVYDEAVTATVTNNSTVPVKSEVFLWLQANQGVSTTPAYGGQMLTTWTDQSPYGHNAQPANLFNYFTNQPFLVSSAINGQPAVQFFGTNILQVPNDPANPINGDMTLFLVLERTDTGAFSEPISKTAGWGGGNKSNLYAAPFDFYFNNTGDGKPTFIYGNGNLSPSALTAASTITQNTPYVVALRVIATNSSAIVINGIQYASGAFNGLQYPTGNTPANTFSAAPQDGGNPIYLGVRGDGLTLPTSPQTFSGYIAETMLIRGTITVNDFSNIDNYLSTKYGIPLAQPVITEDPASLTVEAGQPATFWVNATNLPPFTYQWQSNGVAVSGATNAFYTTPILTSSANGASYTAMVSSIWAYGSANSMPATVTVVPAATPPTVYSASKTASLNNLLVVFSKPVDPGTGLTAANYSLNGGATVNSAAAGSSPNQVVLTTSALNPNTGYVLTVQNVQDQFSNPMVAASVSVMPAGMVMWLRADSGIVTNINAANPNAIDAWMDQTANGNNAITYGEAATQRPTAGNDTADSAAAVLFSSGNRTYLTVNNSPSTALAGDLTLYVVGDLADTSTYHELLGKCNSGQAMSYELNTLTGANKGNSRFSRGDGVGSGLTTGSIAPALGTPFVMSATMQGPNGVQYFNGVSDASGNYIARLVDNGAPLVIGARTPSFDGVWMNGDIPEIIMFSNSISASDRTNVDNYLGAKYFTFTSTGPANSTANAGNTATFSVTASQGSAHLAYQWMEQPAGAPTATNITGANGPSYNTGTLFAGDNGDSFSVVVTIPGTTSSYTLGPAALTVNVVPPQVLTVGEPIWTTNSILVIFQEPVNPTTATTVANYTLNNGATVISAVMRTPTQVYLTTSPLNPALTYQLTVRNVQDQFGAAMITTNLASVVYPSAPVLWLQAGAGVNTNSDGTVYEWDDQSGNGNNFNNTAGAPYEPLIINNAINGFPMLQFNGTNENYLSTYPNSPAPLGLTGDMSIFTVMKFTTFENPNGTDGPQGGGEIISKNDPVALGAPAPYDYYVYYNNPYGVSFLRGNGVNSGTFAPSPKSPTAGVPHILDVTMLGTTITHRLDGQAEGSYTWVGNTITDNGDPVYIGTRPDQNVRLTGGMAELLMFGTGVASNDVVSIENYLGKKYGLLTVPTMTLSFTNNAGTNNVIVSWPASWPFVLQSTPSLSPAVWSAVASPGVSTNPATVTVPATNTARFYRLQYLTPP